MEKRQKLVKGGEDQRVEVTSKAPLPLPGEVAVPAKAADKIIQHGSNPASKLQDEREERASCGETRLSRAAEWGQDRPIPIRLA